MRSIVAPGEMVAEDAVKMRNAFVYKGKTYSKVLGMLDEKSSSIIPLEGAWDPRVDDSVVGIVSGEKGKVYIIDISYFGRAILVPGKYDNYEFKIGDVINAIIKDIESKNTIVLKEPTLLKGGTIINIKPKKIPRVIGKKSTMVRQIADSTKTNIVVGMNGLVWLEGGNIALATEALLKIERDAHLSGLTADIKKFLEERK